MRPEQRVDAAVGKDAGSLVPPQQLAARVVGDDGQLAPGAPLVRREPPRPPSGRAGPRSRSASTSSNGYIQRFGRQLEHAARAVAGIAVPAGSPRARPAAPTRCGPGRRTRTGSSPDAAATRCPRRRGRPPRPRSGRRSSPACRRARCGCAARGRCTRSRGGLRGWMPPWLIHVRPPSAERNTSMWLSKEPSDSPTCWAAISVPSGSGVITGMNAPATRAAGDDAGGDDLDPRGHTRMVPRNRTC